MTIRTRLRRALCRHRETFAWSDTGPNGIYARKCRRCGRILRPLQ